MTWRVASFKVPQFAFRFSFEREKTKSKEIVLFCLHFCVVIQPHYSDHYVNFHQVRQFWLVPKNNLYSCTNTYNSTRKKRDTKTQLHCVFVSNYKMCQHIYSGIKRRCQANTGTDMQNKAKITQTMRACNHEGDANNVSPEVLYWFVPHAASLILLVLHAYKVSLIQVSNSFA